MKSRIYSVCIVAFLAGVMVGIAGYYYGSHSQADYNLEAEQTLGRFMAHAEAIIRDENNNCEGNPVNTVGDALASILGPNIGSPGTPLSAGCSNQVCMLSRSDCKPWQSAECSERFLRVKQAPDGTVKPDTFSCLDMP